MEMTPVKEVSPEPWTEMLRAVPSEPRSMGPEKATVLPRGSVLTRLKVPLTILTWLAKLMP